jgi:hypothetical protein
MNHNYIDQYDLVGRYLMGKLPTQESEQFEEHFVDCPVCIDQLKITRNFLQDLRTVTVRQVSQTEAYRPARRPWYFPQMLTGKPVALAACCLLIAAITGAALMFNQMRRLRSEVEQAKRESLQWEQRYEQERESASLSDDKRQELEQLTARLHEIEEKLLDEQKQRANTATELVARMRPGSNMPILALTSVRAVNSSEPVNGIALTRAPMGFTLLVSLDGEVKYERYVLTILNDRGKRIWRDTNSKPDSSNSFPRYFNSTFFRPGNYELIVEGVSGNSDLIPVGNYPFRVTKNR